MIGQPVVRESDDISGFVRLGIPQTILGDDIFHEKSPKERMLVAIARKNAVDDRSRHIAWEPSHVVIGHTICKCVYRAVNELFCATRFRSASRSLVTSIRKLKIVEIP